MEHILCLCADFRVFFSEYCKILLNFNISKNNFSYILYNKYSVQIFNLYMQYSIYNCQIRI